MAEQLEKPIDERIVTLAREIRELVRSGRPETISELVKDEAASRGLTPWDLVRLIEQVADREGLSDRQLPIRMGPPESRL